MRRLIINMNIRPLDIRQGLQLELQLLCNIMRRAQRLIRIHDDIDLDHQPGPTVPGADGVDGDDAGRVRDADVGEELLGGGVGGEADEEVEFAVRGPEPEGGDEEGEE